ARATYAAPFPPEDPSMNIIDTIGKEQQKSDIAKFKVGDGVRVHTRVVEGDKERIQIFSGTVFGRKGAGINETFTARRISYGEGGVGGELRGGGEGGGGRGGGGGARQA